MLRRRIDLDWGCLGESGLQGDRFHCYRECGVRRAREDISYCRHNRRGQRNAAVSILRRCWRQLWYIHQRCLVMVIIVWWCDVAVWRRVDKSVALSTNEQGFWTNYPSRPRARVPPRGASCISWCDLHSYSPVHGWLMRMLQRWYIGISSWLGAEFCSSYQSWIGASPR